MSDDGDFFDLSHFLPYLLNQAAEESSLAFQQIYKDRYGLLRTDWRVLFHLGNYGRMTATEIGERSKLHKTKISRAVARLGDRRFLHRERSEEDRRSEHLALTNLGMAAYADLRKVAQEYEGKLHRMLHPEETEVLRRALRKLAGMD